MYDKQSYLMLARSFLPLLFLLFLCTEGQSQKKTSSKGKTSTVRISSENQASSSRVKVSFAPSKAEDEDYQLEWISPITEKTNAYNRLRIELRVVSKEVLSEENFSVMIDKIQLEGKAGERSLINKQEEFIFSSTINLNHNFDMHVIEVKLQTPDGKTVLSQPRYIFIEESIQTRIDWVQPNVIELRGNPYTYHEQDFQIKLNLHAQAHLSVSDISILVNGKGNWASNYAKLIGGTDGRYTFTDHISLGNSHAIHTIHVEVFGQTSDVLKASYVPLTKPNLYVLALGPKTDLNYSDRDAKDFADLFTTQMDSNGNSLYGKVEVSRRLAEEATADEMAGVIQDYTTKYKTGNLKVNDVLAVFISSHGFIEGDEFRIKADNFKSSRWERTSLSYQADIVDQLSEIPCKKLIFIDACHSGGASLGRKNSPHAAWKINAAIQSLNSTQGGFISIASSQADQYSYEDQAWQNGAFTEAIIRGLREAKADHDQNNIITILELFQYIEKTVPKLVQSRNRGEIQIPKLVENGLGDIPLYLVDRSNR